MFISAHLVMPASSTAATEKVTRQEYDFATARLPPRVTLVGEQKKLIAHSKQGQRLLVSPIDLVCVAIPVHGRHLPEAERTLGLAPGALVHDRQAEEAKFINNIVAAAFKRDFPYDDKEAAGSK